MRSVPSGLGGRDGPEQKQVAKASAEEEEAEEEEGSRQERQRVRTEVRARWVSRALLALSSAG